MLSKSSCQELDPESQETVTPRDRWKRVVSKLLERNLIPKVDESKKVSHSLEKLVSSRVSVDVDTKLVSFLCSLPFIYVMYMVDGETLI